jgi:dipeptidase
MLFGKNSDRQRNEAHVVESVPAIDHEAGADQTCTYIRINQVRRTHAVLLCRPFWMWGAEMGANEHGVVIGNEAVYAIRPACEEPALTGMDLVRLGLERAASASEAVEVIVALLEKYGQGGNCGHLTPNFYNNAFLVADRTEGWVIETLGREWAVERTTASRALSNAYAIDRPGQCSAGIATLIRAEESAEGARQSLASAIGDRQRTHLGQALERRKRSEMLLESRKGTLSVSDVMEILRDHGPAKADDEQWAPHLSAERTLCMHAGIAECPGQTTGAMVSEVGMHSAVHWVTGTAATCISIFKPAIVGLPLPDHGQIPGGHVDVRTLWWRHETLHRGVLEGDFDAFLRSIRAERDAIEASFSKEVHSVLKCGTRADQEAVLAHCWKRANDLEAAWLEKLPSKCSGAEGESPYFATWREMSRLAGMEKDRDRAHC